MNTPNAGTVNATELPATLSEGRRARIVAAVTEHAQMQQEIDELRRELTKEREDKTLIGVELGQCRVELSDLRIQNQRLQTDREEAVACRVAYETAFASILDTLKDWAPPAPPIATKPKHRRPADAAPSGDRIPQLAETLER